MRITGGVGLDLIIDAIGPSSFRKDYEILRPGGRLIMFGLSEVQTGDKRDIPAVLKGLARMPLATMPWWKSLSMMNENKGVFGLNMLKWWDAEGLDRALEPLAGRTRARRLRARGRRGLPVRARARRAPVHRRAAQRRQGRAHALAASASRRERRYVARDDRAFTPSPASAASSSARSSTSGGSPAFLFFVALLGTFGFIRMSTWMIRKQVSWWPGNVEVGGTHVHHLVWGICAMMIFGYIGVVHQPDSPWWEIITVLFAIGMGLALDEFALWVELKDVYWEKDGRKSIDAMIIAGCAAGILLVGLQLLDDPRRRASGTLSSPASARSGWSAIAIALVNAAKEKLWWALRRLLFWPAGVVARATAREAALDLGAALLSRRAPARALAGPLSGGAGARRRRRRRRSARRPPADGSAPRPDRPGGGQISSKITPSEAAIGIASSAPRMPASWAPASTAMTATAGWIWTAFL